MGLLDKLFGGGEDYPSLGDDNPLSRQLAAVRGPLEVLTEEVSDRIEVVPFRDKAFIFVGKPPKQFGIAWIENGKVNNFKKLIEEKKIPAPRYQLLSDRLREAYEKSRSASRFKASVGSRKILVTQSETLGKDVQEVIREASA
jgi:hypothetical protein